MDKITLCKFSRENLLIRTRDTLEPMKSIYIFL